MDELVKLREEWKTADKWRRVIIEARAKEIKEKPNKEHKHSSSVFKSGIDGNYFIHVCYCGEEILRDFVARRI